ncbi:MAG: hypothetical protein U1E77_16605 [Inhella sp.]
MRSVFLLRHSDSPLQLSKAELLADMEWELAGHAQRWREARERIPLLQPDVLVTDLRVLDGAVPRLIQQLRGRRIRTLVLVPGADEPLLIDALLAGARGYHVEGPKGGGLLNALEDLMEGRMRLSPALARQLLERLGAPRLTPSVACLRSLALDPKPATGSGVISQAQQALLSLLAHGWLAVEIARAWWLEVAEVERRTAQVLRLAQRCTADWAARELLDAA